MRGKVMRKEILRIIHGITPAYAGKREGPKNAQSKVGDHPRVCGEKCIPLTRGHGRQGSPPRMRGKVRFRPPSTPSTRITPAYAGKSYSTTCYCCLNGDHPRVCGEKPCWEKSTCKIVGSPPRMRGQAGLVQIVCRLRGITPAYAGKSHKVRLQAPGRWDHPRVCGEKA